MTDEPGLAAAVEAWLADDPDPATRVELTALRDAGDLAALRDRFAGRLGFGTAGLRGALGAGPNRMNRVVVQRAAAGVAAYTLAHGGDAGVIGFDARHGSDVFARDTAAVWRGAGLDTTMLPGPLPTPLLAFAIGYLGVDVGVMVTASHNPPQDNGYKVYLGDGSQIVPPADTEISAAIDAVGPLAGLPRSDGWHTAGTEVEDAYVDRALSLVERPGPRDLAVVTTPLHGVGGALLARVLREAGFPEPVVVAEQAEPDPDFPTVAFPNPEEPGAIDLALALAARTDADLVIANDPDADRCAVCCRDGSGWRMLRGDEVGALLAWHLLRRGRTGTLATTIVSSTLLAKQAAAADVRYAETLTGFKWLSKVPGLTYAYEEALGYCCDPDGVRDKDGITAALLVCELAAGLKAEGRTLLDVLDDLAREHGLHATDQLSVRVDSAATPAMMATLRSDPPASLGGRQVLAVDDLALGSAGLPPTDGLRFRLADDGRVVVRPSGTEPKLKCYLEVVVPVAAPRDDAAVAVARTEAAAQLAAIRDDLAAALSG